MFVSEVFESTNHYFQSRNNVQKPKLIAVSISCMNTHACTWGHSLICIARAQEHMYTCCHFSLVHRSIMLPLLRYNHTICCMLRALLQFEKSIVLYLLAGINISIQRDGPSGFSSCDAEAFILKLRGY